MNKDKIFLKHKRRFLYKALIKSAVCGLSFGLLVVGVVLLSLKLSAITINAGYYVLMGVGGALVVGGVVFLIFRPTDKYVARRLDEDHDLYEQVQTSLEFKGENGLIVEMQRQAANENMKRLRGLRPRFARIWQYCLIGVLALAVSFTAFLVPAQKVQGETPPDGPVYDDKDETPFELTAYQIAALNDLIENVKSSALAESPKAGTVTQLENLLETLRTAETVGEMRNSVRSKVYRIDKIIGAENNYAEVAAAFESTIPEVTLSINSGIATHNVYVLTEYDNVKIYASNSKDIIYAKLNGYINNDLRIKTIVDKSDGLEGKLDEAVEKIDTCLEAVELGDNDLFKVALTTFRSDLLGVKGRIPSNVNAALQNMLATVFANFAGNLTDAIAVQAYNLAVDKFVEYRLYIIFGIEFELPRDEVDKAPDGGAGGSNDEGNVPGGNDGAGGSGSFKYGSDKEIFDPVTGEFVQYGELLNRYYQIFQEYLASGQLTPEQEEAARVYFDILFSGFADED